MRPLQLQLAVLLTDCVRFHCCSPIVSASCVRFSCCSPVESVCSPNRSGRLQPLSSAFSIGRLHRRSRVTSVVLPPEHPTSVAHINTDQRKLASFPGPAQLFVACSTEKRGEPGMFPHVSITVIDKRPKFSERKSEVTDYTFNAWCVCDSRPPLAR